MSRRPADADPLYKLLGRRINEARKAKGLSQSQLAGSCNLTRGSIANIELGRQHVPLHTLWRIGKVLDREPRSFLPTLEVLEGVASVPRVSDVHDGPAVGVPVTLYFTHAPQVKAFLAEAERELPAHGPTRNSNPSTTRNRADRAAATSRGRNRRTTGGPKPRRQASRRPNPED